MPGRPMSEVMADFPYALIAAATLRKLLRIARTPCLCADCEPLSNSEGSGADPFAKGCGERTLVQRTVLARLVADGLDVVAVEIEDIAAVVVGVVPPQPGCAVVGASCLDGGCMEGVDLRPTLGSQRDVKPPPHRLPFGLDEERRSFSIILAEPGGRFGE